MDVEKLLLEFLKIKSMSGNEIDFCNFLFDFLKGKGLDPQKDIIDSNGFNIILKNGNPKIYLSAHMDTVRDFLKIREDDEYLYGRGACDTKGSLAAMLVAYFNCLKKDIKDFGMIFTIREETDFKGVKSVFKKEDIPFVVVGEPTKLNLIYGNFGALVLKISTVGVSCHSSVPENGKNALEDMIEAINLVRGIKIEEGTLMSIVDFHSGIASNIIPDKAEAFVSFRIDPNDSSDYFALIGRLLEGKAKVEKVFEIEGVINEVPEEFSFIKKREIKKYLTELSVYRRGVVIGPGDSKFAHSEEEKIKKDELRKAVGVYEKIINNYCNK